METTIQQSETISPFSHITRGDLEKIPYIVMHDKIIGLNVTDKSSQDRQNLHDALILHGLFSKHSKVDDNHFLTIDLKTANHQKSLSLLKSAPSDHIGGVIGYNFGPEPDLKTHNIDDISESYEKLHKCEDSGVPEADADLIVDWVSQRTMHALQSNSGTSPLDFSGTCGWAQGHIGHQCEQMGIKVAYHQINNLSESSTNRHAFNIITVPITEETGFTREKHYLVDTTFRQFFDAELNGVNSDNTIRTWGAQLTQSTEGCNLADSLLKKGYVELNDDTARLYVEGQTARLNNQTGHYDPVAWEVKTPVARLLESTTVNDYDLSEMKNEHIMPPSALSKIKFVRTSPISDVEISPSNKRALSAG